MERGAAHGGGHGAVEGAVGASWSLFAAHRRLTLLPLRAGRGEDDFLPGTFKLKKNPSNDHLIDRALQKSSSFTGITGVGTQDMAVQECMEPIVDRSKEMLIWTDKAIMSMRKILLENTYCVERGEAPAGVLPQTHSHLRAFDAVIASDADWREAFKDLLKPKW